ncbi:uncharacterized protein LOC124372566 [Homalodisca vitripennis]|uniref:uncharacterized protein LOC124370159 n=2 Tax=Homalodisca vitripennis TaxID=197043 RepID=UPI001EEA4BAA|nr:uncharacterized protein LOC124357911 isoform X2 [Homalodisca vitripennis]XP_046684408.1 uncharacterized protein LOC124370159 [Homalodisca vitripennis]XP_046686923.1 uncharacterized protein LOC124372566 [Homalodisca vitripennis]
MESRGKFILSKLKNLNTFTEDNLKPETNDCPSNQSVEVPRRNSTPSPTLTELKVLNPDCTSILVLPDNDSTQWNFNMHESENIQVERETSKDVHLLNFISTPVEPESNEWELETITQVTNMEQESGASTTLEDLDDALSSVSDLFENDIDDPTYTPPSGSESDSTLSNDLEQVQSQSVSTNTTANNNNIIPLVPYTDSDDTESELPIVTQPKNKGRKRIRNEKKWKKKH